MALINVIGYKLVQEDLLRRMEVDPKEEDFIWTDVALYSDEIREFYKRTNVKTVLEFYDDRQPLTIKEPFEKFYERMEKIKSKEE